MNKTNNQISMKFEIEMKNILIAHKRKKKLLGVDRFSFLLMISFWPIEMETIVKSHARRRKKNTNIHLGFMKHNHFLSRK